MKTRQFIPQILSAWLLLASAATTLLPRSQVVTVGLAALGLICLIASYHHRRLWLLLTPFVLVLSIILLVPSPIPEGLPGLVRLLLSFIMTIAALIIIGSIVTFVTIRANGK